MLHFNLRGFRKLIDENRRTLEQKVGWTRQRVSVLVGGDLPCKISTFLKVLNALGIEDVGRFFFVRRGGQEPASAREVDLIETEL